MAYTEQEAARLIALIQSVESHKEHPYAAPTYRDTPALQELDAMVHGKLEAEPERDQDTLEDSIIVLRFLSESYMKQWKIRYAQHRYKELLELETELYSRFDIRDENCGQDYHQALAARNIYQKDPCPDLSALVADMLPDAVRQQTEQQVFQQYPGLKHDPVELTDAYLSVIDEVERRIAEADPAPVHPLERSIRGAELLREYGVIWQSEIQLNPRVHFD